MAKKTNEQDIFTVTGNTFKLIIDSWQALLLNVRTFILLAIIPMVVFLLAIPFVLIPFFMHGSSRTIGGFIAFLVVLAALAIAFVFVPAITITQIASAKGQKMEFDDAIKQARPIVWRYLGLTLLTGLSVVLGLVLLIIPGLLAAFFFSMATYIFLDKKTGVTEAMRKSYELVKNNWVLVLSLFVVNAVVSAVSYIPIVGWIISMALSFAYFCLPAIIYTKIRQ